MKREQLLLTWGGMAFMAMSALLGCSGSNNQQNGDENEIDKVEIDYSVCKPSTLQCKDLDNLEKCNETGDGWLADKTCGSDEYCKKDACVKYTVCKPETLNCKDAEFVEKCGANGEQWILYKRCRVDEQCKETNCVKTQQDGDEETDQEIEQTETDAEEQLPCACPGHPEMALVEMPNGDKYCIDRYEATVFENPDCTGKIYGQQGDDWPEALSECIGCADIKMGGTQRCEKCEAAPNLDDIKAYPCVLNATKPSWNTTFFQSYFLCKKAGKTLCEYSIWENACSNKGETDYPYGNSFEEGFCNETAQGVKPTGLTVCGANEHCTSKCGVGDLMGNLDEWTYHQVNDSIWEIKKGSNYTTDIFDGIVNVICKNVMYGTALEIRFTGTRCCIPISK